MKGLMTLICFFISAGLTTSNAQIKEIAPWCGELLPMITDQFIGAPHRRIHFAPKYCNKIMVGGTIENIPSATAVVSGGISADVTNTCVDKVCGQALRPRMLYRSYIFKDNGALKFNFSVKEHKEDAIFGNEVHVDDPGQSFVGLVYTDENGLICGGASSLCVLSWFYRGHTALVSFIGPIFGKPPAQACDTPGGHVAGVDQFDVTILTFGVNSTFRQGYTVPNFYLMGTLTNTVVGASSYASIGLEWGGTPVAFEIGSPGVVRWSKHLQGVGSAVIFRTTGALPSPLAPEVTYYVANVPNRNSFTLAATPGGPEIALSGPQSGDHIIIKPAAMWAPRSSFFKNSASDTGSLATVAVGGGGAEEGFIRARVMLGTPNGGCAVIPEGVLTTSPHHS